MNLAIRKSAKQERTRQRRPVSCCFMPLRISPQRLANAESLSRGPYSTAFGMRARSSTQLRQERRYQEAEVSSGLESSIRQRSPNC